MVISIIKSRTFLVIATLCFIIFYNKWLDNDITYLEENYDSVVELINEAKQIKEINYYGSLRIERDSSYLSSDIIKIEQQLKKHNFIRLDGASNEISILKRYGTLLRDAVEYRFFLDRNDQIYIEKALDNDYSKIVYYKGIYICYFW